MDRLPRAPGEVPSPRSGAAPKDEEDEKDGYGYSQEPQQNPADLPLFPMTFDWCFHGS